MPDPSGPVFRILDYVTMSLMSVVSFLASTTLLRVNKLDRESVPRTELKEEIKGLRDEANDRFKDITSRLDKIIELVVTKP